MKKLLLTISTITLASCSTNQTGNLENRLGYYPPVLSKVILKQPLKVESDKAGLYIQDGQANGSSHSRFKPFCYIRFVNVKQTPRTIQPGTFTIKSSRIETRLITKNKPFSTPYGIISYRLADSTPSDILEVITMRIVSVKQPNVYLLECGGVENSPSQVEPPTIADIRQAMGSIMSLQLHH